MKLLEPEKVKADKHRQEAETDTRIALLKQEESASAKRLNESLEHERKEKERIDESLKLATENLATYESAVDAKRSAILRELETLEARQKEALKPIHEKKQEAEALFEQAKQSLADAQRHRDASDELRDALEEKLNDLGEKEADISEKAQDLDRRESAIKDIEDETARQTKSIADKWIEYYKKSHEANESLARRENEVKHGKKVNEDIRAEIEKERQRISEEDRAVCDKYKALEQAKIHLGIQ